MSEPADGAGAPSARLEVAHLTKTYPGTLALSDFSLSLVPGEVHSLVGTNGSGKSTLIKILAGVTAADPGGTITVNGESVPADSVTPTWASGHGMRFVHQQPAIFDDLTVAENLSHGRGFEKNALRTISWRQTEKRAAEVLARFNLNINPSKPLGALRPAQRMMVAIVRALQDQDESAGGVLVLDEPTAALPKAEVVQLLDTVASYAAAGRSILYVSHRLDEILFVSDRVTVIRDGQLKTTTDARDLTHDRLVQLMLGKAVGAARTARSAPAASLPDVLSVDHLAGGPVHDVSLTVRSGEVVGIAGLLGSGRSHLLRMLFGCDRRAAGTMKLAGQDYAPTSPARAIARGVAFVPEDRAADAAFLDQSVSTNLTIADMLRNFRRVFLDPRAERGTSRTLISSFGVRTASESTLISSLSGGNQQKVVLARWLAKKPRLLLLDEPSQGVDAGARADIHAYIREAVDAGAGAVMVSSDSEELAQHCDRVLVLAGGTIIASLPNDDLTADKIDQIVLSSQVQKVSR